MNFIKTEGLSYDDVTILAQYSDITSRSCVSLETDDHSAPFIGSPMWHLDTKEMVKFFHKNNMPFVLHRYFPSALMQIERWHELTENLPGHPNTVFVAVGSDTKWIGDLVLRGVKSFCVDMAHGNSMQAVNAVKFIKEYCPEATIMAGNIESHDGWKRLYEAGATYFRVGIGSGSICSTHTNTGCGLPMLTALRDISGEMGNAQRRECKLIADGGIRTAGDVAKALAFGADYAMCGKLFASTSKAKGPFFNKEGHMLLDQDGIEEREDIFFVQYAGMASKMMREMAGGSQKTNVSEEGKGGLVEYAGRTEDVFEQLSYNLQAVLAYSGCLDIDQFKQNALVQRLASGGFHEKQIHLDKVYR